MDSINLEIIIERPSNDDPLGYIGLVAKNNSSELTDEGETYRCFNRGDLFRRRHMKRVLEAIQNQFNQGQQPFAARVQNASAVRPEIDLPQLLFRFNGSLAQCILVKLISSLPSSVGVRPSAGLRSLFQVGREGTAMEQV